MKVDRTRHVHENVQPMSSFFFKFCHSFDELVSGLRVAQFAQLCRVAQLINRTPASRSYDFVNHSFDYRPNWTPRGPVTITNQNYDKILECDWSSPARFER